MPPARIGGPGLPGAPGPAASRRIGLPTSSRGLRACTGRGLGAGVRWGAPAGRWLRAGRPEGGAGRLPGPGAGVGAAGRGCGGGWPGPTRAITWGLPPPSPRTGALGRWGGAGRLEGALPRGTGRGLVLGRGLGAGAATGRGLVSALAAGASGLRAGCAGALLTGVAGRAGGGATGREGAGLAAADGAVAAADGAAAGGREGAAVPVAGARVGSGPLGLAGGGVEGFWAAGGAITGFTGAAGAAAGRAGWATMTGGPAGRAGGFSGAAAGEAAAAAGDVAGAAFFTARIALPGSAMGAVVGFGADMEGGVGREMPLPLGRISFRIRAASSSLIELLWLRAAMDSFSAASSTSLLSRPRSLDNS